LTEEKGVQSKCGGGTMSAALNINTDSDLIYQIFDPSPQKSDLTSVSKVQALSDLSLPTEI
jgi:hypothetical protein